MKTYVLSLVMMETMVVFMAEAAKPGVVTLKINPALVQVNLGERDVTIGDRVAIYKKTCTGGRTQVCKKDPVGEGSVSRVLNETYSEIQLDSGVHVSEGYLIERK